MTKNRHNTQTFEVNNNTNYLRIHLLYYVGELCGICDLHDSSDSY